MTQEDTLLSLSIQDEAKEMKTYSEKDMQTLQSMIYEINGSLGTDIHSLSELDYYRISGTGKIIIKYIHSYSSETIRSYLVHQLVHDRIADCGEILVQLYNHFKQSDVYISKEGEPAPVHIAIRYDNAFKRLRPKSVKNELCAFAYIPRDAFYLPLTMRMLASWRIPEIEKVLISYLDGKGLTPESIGLPSQAETYHPSFSFIKRELKFTAIDSLKNYPSENTVKMINYCVSDSDADIRTAAKRTLKQLERQMRGAGN